MQTLVERGCGLDVHQATVVACLLIVWKNGRVQKQVRTFGTTTRELVRLREWLLSEGCTQVAMESTGVYWKPVYAILEGAFEIVVANAQHVKKVPGRKTDVKDAEWIADLLCHGLLRPSFVPPSPIRELRDLTRYRRKLVESRTAERNRLLKLGDRQFQVGQCSHGCFRGLRSTHAACSCRGPSHRARDGRTGQKATAQEDPRTGAGSGRKSGRTPPFLVARATTSTPGSGRRSWHSRATHSGEAQALCSAVHLVAGNTGYR
jgi:transposase